MYVSKQSDNTNDNLEGRQEGHKYVKQQHGNSTAFSSSSPSTMSGLFLQPPQPPTTIYSYNTLGHLAGLSTPTSSSYYNNNNDANPPGKRSGTSAVSSLSSDDESAASNHNKSDTSDKEGGGSGGRGDGGGSSRSRGLRGDSSASSNNGSNNSNSGRKVRINTGYFQEHLVFRKLFYSRDDDGVENPFLGDRMRVSSNKSNNSAGINKGGIAVPPSASSTPFADGTCYIQTLHFHRGAVWTMKFSPSGHYLASGGQDGRVVVWCVGASLGRSRSNSSAVDRSVSGDSYGSSTPSSYSPSSSPEDDDEGNDKGYDQDTENDIYNGSSAMQDSSSHNSRNNIDQDCDPTDNGSEPDDFRSSRNNSSDTGGTGTDTSSRTTSFDESPHARSIHDVLHPEPYRVFEGHTGDIIDISFSKANFILSASIDKTVRLWHVTRADSLQLFSHPDMVTAVAFHPLHDRFFVSGCFDLRVRVWDVIPDGTVKEWSSTPDTITALAFSPDGQTVASGLINGQVFFYAYEGMKVKTRVDCRDSRGKHSGGTKVTGVAFRPGVIIDKNDLGSDSGSGRGNSIRGTAGEVPQLLVSTNDSRLRLCKLDDYSVTCKYKARNYKNKSMQIKASFSENGEYVISGSDNGQCVIWSTIQLVPERFLLLWRTHRYRRKYRNSAHESFDASGAARGDVATTVAIFAPSGAVRHIVKSQVQNLYSPQEVLSRYQAARVRASSGGKVAGIAGEDNSNSKRGGGGGGDVITGGGTTTIQQDMDSFYSRLPADDLCSRVIITADLEGRMHVFYRIGAVVAATTTGMNSAAAPSSGEEREREREYSESPAPGTTK